MQKSVNIASVGVVSALGTDAPANLQSLCGGHSGLTKVDGRCEGRVALSDDDMRRLTLCPKVQSRTTLLALTAVLEAVAPIQTLLPQAMLISATTVGGMDCTPIFYSPFRQGLASRLRYVGEHEASSHTEAIARRLGIQSFRTTISTACSSGANAIMLGARLICAGLTDVVICGGTDALCDYTRAGFGSLMILSPEPCRPLSADRTGLNLGEAAAYVVLTSERVSAPSVGRLVGWANANDAFHQTAMTAEGRGGALAMSSAICMAGLSPQDISYINLHGTATQNNDSSELSAINTVWNGQPLPPLSSTKSLTGHTLAAAGALEAVFCIMALQQQMLWPNANFTSGDVQPVLAPVSAHLSYALSNSLGFGGNCTSLVFSK